MPRERDLNRHAALELLSRLPGISRAELGQALGVSRATTAAILAEFEAAGLLELEARVGTANRLKQRTGRPPLGISLKSDAAFALGLELDGDRVRVAMCDLHGRVLGSASESVPAPGTTTSHLELAETLVARTCEQVNAPADRVLGVGAALAPGWPADSSAAHDWSTTLEQSLGWPVRLASPANCGAIAEHRFGAGRGASDMLYVRWSADIGLGLIVGDRLYRGGAGLAGALGHVRVQENGPICSCGNRGCLQVMATPQAMAELMERSRGEPLSVAQLLALVSAGDRGARRAAADASHVIGAAVAAVVNVLNPQRILIGGELAAAPEVIMEPFRAALAADAFPPAAAELQISTGLLGAEATVIGAAAMVLTDAPATLARRSWEPARG